MILNELILRNLKPRDGQYDVFDEALAGFGARVSQGGTLSFIVLYRENGKKRRITLGKWPSLKLKAARKAARTLLAKITLEERAPILSDTTFGEAMTAYLGHLVVRAAPGHHEEVSRLLKTHFTHLSATKLRHFNERPLRRARSVDQASAVRSTARLQCPPCPLQLGSHQTTHHNFPYHRDPQAAQAAGARSGPLRR